MKSVILPIGKQNWLLGMTWEKQDKEPTKKEVVAKAKELAKGDEPLSWVTSKRNETVIQTGFAAPIYDGKPKALFSLAGAIADMHEQPWLGRFRLALNGAPDDGAGEELWWCVAIHEGHSVLVDGDVVGNKDEVLDKVQELGALAEWKMVEGDLADIADLVARARAKHSKVWLAEEVKVPKFILAGTAVVLVGASVLGYKIHLDQVEEQRLQSLRVIEAAKKNELPKPQVDASYMNAAEPMIWLAACKETLAPLKLVDRGWDLSSVECGISAATITRTRAGFATIAYRPDGALSGNNDVKKVIPLGLAKPKGSLDLPMLNAGRDALQAWSQRVGVTVTIDTPPAPLPGTQSSPVPQVVPRSITFSFSINSTPLDASFADQLGAIEGLRVTNISRKVSDDGSEGWLVKGSIYGS